MRLIELAAIVGECTLGVVLKRFGGRTLQQLRLIHSTQKRIIKAEEIASHSRSVYAN